MPQGWCDANLDSFCAHRRQRCAGRDEETDSEIHSEGKRCATLANSLTKKAPYKGLGADSEEKREPLLWGRPPLAPFTVAHLDRLAHAGCFNTEASTGNLRRRLPIAANMALVTAGTISDVPASPMPPGGSWLCTMCTSTSGASFMRSN